jgi:hypothetical protein
MCFHCDLAYAEFGVIMHGKCLRSERNLLSSPASIQVIEKTKQPSKHKKDSGGPLGS